MLIVIWEYNPSPLPKIYCWEGEGIIGLFFIHIQYVCVYTVQYCSIHAVCTEAIFTRNSPTMPVNCTDVQLRVRQRRGVGTAGGSLPPPTLTPTLPYMVRYICEHFANFVRELLVNIASIVWSKDSLHIDRRPCPPSA